MKLKTSSQALVAAMMGTMLSDSVITMICGSGICSQYSAMTRVPSGYDHCMRRATRSLVVAALTLPRVTNNMTHLRETIRWRRMAGLVGTTTWSRYERAFQTHARLPAVDVKAPFWNCDDSAWEPRQLGPYRRMQSGATMSGARPVFMARLLA